LSLSDETAEKPPSTVTLAKKVKGVAKIAQVAISSAGELIAGGTTRGRFVASFRDVRDIGATRWAYLIAATRRLMVDLTARCLMLSQGILSTP
jgi:hypothetical protein